MFTFQSILRIKQKKLIMDEQKKLDHLKELMVLGDIDGNKVKRSCELIDQIDDEKNMTQLRKRIGLSDKRSSRIHFLTPRFYRIAAVVILLILGGAYWYHKDYTQVTPPIITRAVQTAIRQSSMSGMQGAEITSSQTVGNAIISHEEQVLYHVDEDFVEQLEEARRVSTYHDKEYWVTLDDGTLVHLNYDSRLIYPEKFGDRRDVILDGEAFFMVAKDKSRQFVVHTPQGDIRVFGTEFFVTTSSRSLQAPTVTDKGYVVLVEGSIGFTPTNGKEQKLQPGQQLIFSENQLSVRQVDLAPYVAWNEGKFLFEDCPLWQLMAVLERWHHVTTLYKSEKLKDLRFMGSLNRYDNIEPTLKAIEKSTGVNVVLKDNTVIVGE